MLQDADVSPLDGSMDAAVLYRRRGCAAVADGEGLYAGACVGMGSREDDDVTRGLSECASFEA